MVLITTLLIVLSSGAPQAPASPPPSTAPAEYVAGPQAVHNNVVVGAEDLTKTVSLDADGTFDYPYVGRVNAGGLTARAIGEAIARRLKNFYVNPQVTVEVEPDAAEIAATAAASRAPLGRHGRYHVLKAIGEGGMAVVYSAFDEELDRRNAI